MSHVSHDKIRAKVSYVGIRVRMIAFSMLVLLEKIGLVTINFISIVNF